MSGATDGLRQMAQYFRPSNLKQLREAGAVHPKGPIGLIGALPWLLGRGPSLGILTQTNAFVLGDKPALHDRQGTLSWKELERRVNQTANALRATGLAPGDSVGLLLRNGREILEVTFAAQKLGLVCCPFNTWAKPKELEATIRHSNISLLVYDTAHGDQVKAAVPDTIGLVAVGDQADALAGSLDYEVTLADQKSSQQFPFTRDRGSAKVIIHTSGTTGVPKGAQRNASAAGIGALSNLLRVVPYKREDIVYCPAPLFHSFGLATFTVATALGCTMILPERFDPEGSLELIEKHRATAASFVPVMLRRIVSLEDDVKSSFDVSSMRVLLASGSAMSEDLRRAAKDLFGDVIYDLYGSTEIGWVAIATPEDMARHPRTVGRPVPGVEIAVLSPSGEMLDSGQIGELYIKSDIIFEGYTSGETKDVRSGYMTIGDVGRIDDEGFLHIEGRADDMVVVGGENIYPIEIEDLIEDIDGVTEVAVLGVPDHEYGEVLAAFVVGDVDVATVEKICRAELASYKVPRRIEIVPELPRNATGKVVKREIEARSKS